MTPRQIEILAEMHAQPAEPDDTPDATPAKRVGTGEDLLALARRRM